MPLQKTKTHSGLRFSCFIIFRSLTATRKIVIVFFFTIPVAHCHCHCRKRIPIPVTDFPVSSSSGHSLPRGRLSSSSSSLVSSSSDLNGILQEEEARRRRQRESMDMPPSQVLEVEMNVDESTNLRTPEKGVDKIQIPHVGMIFESSLEARNYYEDYGRQEGFWVRTRSSYKSRSRSNEVTSVIFVCAHEGKYAPKDVQQNFMDEDITGTHDEEMKTKKRRCSTVKGGCIAKMRINHDKWSNKWEVTVFNDDHNHKVVTPVRRMKMKSNKNLPKAVKDLTEAFHKENLEIGKVPSILGGEYIGFDRRDCYNHLRNVRHRELECGDAQSVLTYFRKKQAENPQFFYAVQCDEDGRATNFFWVDARSRMSYHYFGDVVTFDTTYRTNKYDMPFAPFTGVNHHYQTIQFGCALLQDETELTFTWLFETWLEAMGGRPPVSIITDQDLGMKGAISKVFPNTRHRLCYWHIKKKFVEKLSHLYYEKSKFKIEVKNCIWSTHIQYFESKWEKLIKAYGLEGNEWLKQLFNIRASWVPVYNWNTFYAGMNTTGRSEGINAFFDAFVTSQTNLRDFVVKYEQALKKIVDNESNEDFESEHKYRIVKENEFLLHHASTIYTRNLFNKFKEEWDVVNCYKVEEGEFEDGYRMYLLTSKLGGSKQKLVLFNLQTLKGTCECKKFEFVGIPCRHILKLFVRLDIDAIPAHFIAPRWKKEANKFRVMDSRDLLTNDDDNQGETLRLHHLCRESTKLSCYAAKSVDAYTICIEVFKDLSVKLESVLRISTSHRDMVEPSSNVHEDVDSPSQSLLLDPKISKTKGRKKEVQNNQGQVRLKSGIELSMAKKKRRCNLCHKLARHDKRNCPLNPKNKKRVSFESSSEGEDANELEEDTFEDPIPSMRFDS